MRPMAYCLAEAGDTRGRRPGASVWPRVDMAEQARVMLSINRGQGVVVRPLALPAPFESCARPYNRPELVGHLPMWVLDVHAAFADQPTTARPDPALEGFF